MPLSVWRMSSEKHDLISNTFRIFRFSDSAWVPKHNFRFGNFTSTPYKTWNIRHRFRASNTRHGDNVYSEGFKCNKVSNKLCSETILTITLTFRLLVTFSEIGLHTSWTRIFWKFKILELINIEFSNWVVCWGSNFFAVFDFKSLKYL